MSKGNNESGYYSCIDSMYWVLSCSYSFVTSLPLFLLLQDGRWQQTVDPAQSRRRVRFLGWRVDDSFANSAMNKLECALVTWFIWYAEEREAEAEAETNMSTSANPPSEATTHITTRELSGPFANKRRYMCANSTFFFPGFYGYLSAIWLSKVLFYFVSSSAANSLLKGLETVEKYHLRNENLVVKY